MSRSLLFVPLLLATGVVWADDAPKDQPEVKVDSNLGMSVLGNQEAPKALVLVPWKGSEIGASLGISTMLDDSRQPIDKDVFMRSLSYYDIRSETTPHDGASPAPAARRSKS